jgi:THO complex subunit 1
MKNSISSYLRLGMEGPYFLRMVETVLSRDKNWVRWKIENCPPISKPSVTPQAFVDSRSTIRTNTTNKRLKTPMGAVNLSFLRPRDPEEMMKQLQDPSRWTIPDLKSFQGLIADSEFDVGMATTGHARAAAMESKASKTWRAMRIAAKTRLKRFDKIEDLDKIDAVFEESEEEVEDEDEVLLAQEGDLPADKTFVIVAGPEEGSRISVVEGMMAKKPGVFKRVVRHTTQALPEGQTPPAHFQVVTAETFGVMRDGDQFLEYATGDNGGVETGTATKNIHSVAEKGFVPMAELGAVDAVQMVRDMMFPARIVLVKPETGKMDGWDEETVKFDHVVVATEVEAAVEAVLGFVFGEAPAEATADGARESGDGAVGNGDAAMEDAPPPAETNGVPGEDAPTSETK